MKKSILLTLFTSLFLLSHAQYGYLRLGGGYSWNGFQKTGQILGFQPGPGILGIDPANSMIIALRDQNLSDTSGGQFIANVNNGYARGATATFYGGYMINPYFGVEMGFLYLGGATTKSRMEFNDPALGAYTVLSTSTKSVGFSMMPGVYIRGAKPESKVAPIARFGLTIPFAGATYHSLSIDAPNFILGTAKSEINVKTESTFSLGFNGGLGISYSPIPLIQISGEISGQYMLVKPAKSTITKYDLVTNGVLEDRIPSLSTYSTQTEFVDKLDEKSNTTRFGKLHIAKGGYQDPALKYVDEDKPRQELRTSANFGAIGFNISVSFKLSKKIFANPLGK